MPKRANGIVSFSCHPSQPTPAAESFAALFEESLSRRKCAHRRSHHRRSGARRPQLRGRQRRPEVRSYIPVEEFRTTAANSRSSRATSSASPSNRSKTATAKPACRATRPSASRPGTTSTRPSRGHARQGVITGKVKGGLTVMTNGIRAFLPGSLVDTRPVKDTTPYEGKNSISRSSSSTASATTSWCRAAPCSKPAWAKSARSCSRTCRKAHRQGHRQEHHRLRRVRRPRRHRRPAAHHRPGLAPRAHPSEVLNVGDEVTAKVLKFDQEKNRVSLGMKQLGEDPWVGISRRYPQGTRLFGKVTNLTDYGAFVEIERASKAWCTSPRWTGPTRTCIPSKVVQLGDEVEVMVLEIDEDRRRISLGMKQCMAEPVGRVRDEPQEGRQGPGQIKSITDFGIFIGLPGGIDGLVHLSDLSWSPPAKKPCATTRRATKSRPWCCRSTSSASASRSASSSSRATPSPATSPPTTRTAIVTGTVKSSMPRAR
jgi:small subunit ribosomal protein S1